MKFVAKLSSGKPQDERDPPDHDNPITLTSHRYRINALYAAARTYQHHSSTKAVFSATLVCYV